jgi:CheY-like chemotaxis protein
MDKKRPTVVLIDDSPAIRLFFEQSVDASLFDLQSFGSANDSMAFLGTHRPDLLVIDNFMPEKDGLTFLQELRRSPLHAATPVVLISSKEYAQDRTAAKDLGVIEFVTKPINAKTIQDLIQRLAGIQEPVS